MLIHNNIDITDAAQNTKHPFMGHCALSLGDTALTPGAFMSIKIYLSEGMVAPARINRITAERVEFTDNQGTFIGAIKLPKTSGITWRNTAYNYLSCFILNEYNVIVGHVTTAITTPMELLGAAKAAGGVFNPGVDDFLLLPQCHTASFTGSIRAININGEVTTRNVALETGALNIRTVYKESTLNTDGNEGKAFLSFDIAKPILQPGKKNGIRSVCVKKTIQGVTDPITGVTTPDTTETTSYEADGCHLILRPAWLSNLRVITQDGAIILKGVTDE